MENSYLETKKKQLDNPSDNQNLVLANRNHKNTNAFLLNNVAVESDNDVKYNTQTTTYKNSTESLVRESTVLTKTVIRKKTLYLNGEVVEEEEEERSECLPNSREFSSITRSFGNEGSTSSNQQLSRLSNRDRFNGNKFSNFPTNFKFSNANMKFPPDLLATNVNDEESDNDPFFNISKNNLIEGMESKSINIKSSNHRTTQRTMAFSSIIDGKINPSVMLTEQTSCYSKNEGSKNINDKTSINDKYGINDKLSITELPALPGIEDREKGGMKSVMKKLGFGKKDDIKLKDNIKIGKIINELNTTEEKYIGDLSRLVDNYMTELERPDAPRELVEDKTLLFGNVEHIYMFHDVQFFTDLKESEKLPSAIANCFLKHVKEFVLYRHYNRNKPITEKSLLLYGKFFEAKQKELDDMQSLASYLIKPTQRIGRYILLLQEMLKECKKNNVTHKEVDEAIHMLQTEIKFGNDLMALDALKELPTELDIKAQGDLIYRDKFKVTTPEKKKKYDAMIFLFREMIIISNVKLEDNVDIHYYIDHKIISELGITECEDPKTFEIWSYKRQNKNYTLETKPEIRKLWTEAINKFLSEQLENLREKSKRNSTLDQSKLIDLTNQKFVNLNVPKKKSVKTKS